MRCRMILPRIFFDTNRGTEEHGYWLGFDQSLKDLEILGDKLRDGARVIIYMSEELEMDAVLRFDLAATVWWADPISGTIKYLDGT